MAYLCICNIFFTRQLCFGTTFLLLILSYYQNQKWKNQLGCYFLCQVKKKINVPFIAYFTYTIYLLRQRKWEKRYSEVKTVELVLLRSAFNFLLGFWCPLWTLVNHLWPVSLKSTVCHKKKRWIKWTFGNLLGYLSIQR